MKKFGDLKFGDVLYVGFSKKNILTVEPDPYSKGNIIICTSDCESYKVSPNVSFDYFNIDSFIASDKEAIVNHFVEKLHDLLIGYDSTRMYYEYLLKLAKEL
jgi:hypothetical protein